MRLLESIIYCLLSLIGWYRIVPSIFIYPANLRTLTTQSILDKKHHFQMEKQENILVEFLGNLLRSAPKFAVDPTTFYCSE